MPDIKKLNLNDPSTKSADIVAGNIVALKAFFPEAFSEGKIDFEVLRSLLGAAVNEREEKYGLNWHGKRRARQIALTPSTGTLLPCPEESVDWDTTQNLMIEGDNLEVLKLLQKSYVSKVKLIYIDPPYNTGNDFVYSDDFRDSINNYLELTNQIEDGRKLASNTEASGRFHTSWLNMMLPRLKSAHSLLKKDGLLFVSIADHEVSNLRLLLDSIFGEENFLAQVVWQKIHSTKNDAKYFSETHEYLIIYARDAESAKIELLPRTEEMNARFANPDHDPRGDWASADLVANEERRGGYYEILGPTGKSFNVPQGKHWLYAQENMLRLVQEGRLWFGKNGDSFPRLKRYLNEIQQGRKCDTIWLSKEVGNNQESKREVNKLFDGGEYFNNPKPTRLIQRCIHLSTSPGDIVLDFFAGSGTTGHAVLLKNLDDDGKRRFILVQLPEPLSKDEPSQRAAATFLKNIGKPQNIAELTKERLRRAAEKVKASIPLFGGDIGFRVFKLAQSNIRAWEPDAADLEKSLLKNAEHLVQGRDEQDVLFELLLKLGLDLCVPIETKTIAGKPVHSIGGGALIVCLAGELSQDVVEELASGMVSWRAALAPAVDTRVVFKDSGFVDDIAKTNMAAILNQNGITDVRSL